MFHVSLVCGEGKRNGKSSEKARETVCVQEQCNVLRAVEGEKQHGPLQIGMV